MTGRAVFFLMCLVVSSAAIAAESGPHRRAPCSVVRFYVAKYTAPAVEAWARKKGASDAEIEAARLCIKDSPAQTADQTQPTQWAAQ